MSQNPRSEPSSKLSPFSTLIQQNAVKDMNITTSHPMNIQIIVIQLKNPPPEMLSGSMILNTNVTFR